jgi:hypothetical protein
VTRPDASRCWICSALLVTVAARSRPSFAVRWGTRGARRMILSVRTTGSAVGEGHGYRPTHAVSRQARAAARFRSSVLLLASLLDTGRPSTFQAWRMPSCRRPCECGALSLIAAASCWLLRLVSAVVATRRSARCSRRSERYEALDSSGQSSQVPALRCAS